MGMVRTDDGLGIRQRREGLVPLRREEQAFQVPTEAVALIVLPEQGIELLTVGLKRTRGRGNGKATSHGCFS
jgi:hypothetical protein